MELLAYLPLIAAGILLALLLLRILSIPLRLLLKLLANTAIGFVGLLLFNLFGSLVGLQIPVNWITILVTGILGLPGVALLLLAQYAL